MDINLYKYENNNEYYMEKEKSISQKEVWLNSSGFSSLEKYMKTPTWIYNVNKVLRTGVSPYFDPFIFEDILLFDRLFDELPADMKNSSPVQLYRGLA